jgi:polyisoprenoid-binding protein YceI
MRFAALVLCVLLTAPAAAQELEPEALPAPWLAPPGTYTLDPATVSVTMTARRFLMSPIRARFGTVEGALTVTAQAPDASALMVEIAAGDLTANGPIVENMLKGEDFLNAEVHPAIIFTAGSFTVSDAPASLAGDLAMAGVTHPATFGTQLESFELVPETEEVRLRFVSEGELARADWGMTGYRALVSDTVRIRIEADFVRAGAPVTPAAVAAD